AQVWNWSLTTAAKTAFTFGENIASTNGAGAQYILGVGTLASSTAAPLTVVAQGTTILDTTNAGVLTLTSQGASTWSTASGNLTLQAGSGTVSLGSSTALTASGALTVSSGGAAALTLDSASNILQIAAID